jgi:PAS domain S-box-containing protein
MTHPIAILSPIEPYPIIYCNNSYCELLEKTKKDLIGKCPDLMIDEIRVTNPMRALNVLRSFKHSDGKIVWVVTHIQPIYDNDELLGYIRMPRDVTSQILELTQHVINIAETIKNNLYTFNSELHNV